MKKMVRFLFLVIITFTFMVSIVRAQGFYVQFIDKNDPGINFSLFASNDADQIYYIGIASPDHSSFISEPIEIDGNDYNYIPSIYWYIPEEGAPLYYDVYLTSDFKTYYWTSHGDASGNSTGATLSIDWLSGNSKILVFNFATSTEDEFRLVPVPIPPALYLLGSGIVALSLVRRKI